MLLAVITLLSVSPLAGQRLFVGDRAPDLKPHSWLANTPDLNGKPAIIEFFHSTNKYSVSRLKELDRLARNSKGKLVVVVVTRENDPEVKSLLTTGGPAYYPMLDSGGRTFSAYGVQYVPFAVVHDRRGRIVWVGNPTSLTNDEILQLIK